MIFLQHQQRGQRSSPQEFVKIGSDPFVTVIRAIIYEIIAGSQ